MDEQKNQQPQNVSGMMSGMKKQGGMGPAIGIVIIIILLVAGGYYFWQQRADTMKEGGGKMKDASMDQDSTRAALEEQSPSDELVDIENDLTATNVNTIDEELINVEQETKVQ